MNICININVTCSIRIFVLKVWSIDTAKNPKMCLCWSHLPCRISTYTSFFYFILSLFKSSNIPQCNPKDFFYFTLITQHFLGHGLSGFNLRYKLWLRVLSQQWLSCGGSHLSYILSAPRWTQRSSKYSLWHSTSKYYLQILFVDRSTKIISYLQKIFYLQE